MIRYEVLDGVATITIDDPERRNPMSTETMKGLRSHTRAAIDDPTVRVIVYTGAGDRAFSAGGDLSGGVFDDPVGLHRERGEMAELFRTMRRGGKPTVARVNGHALAGGFGLAVACDITICVDTAKLGLTEVNVGLWPMMITAVLAAGVSQKAALELMMTGRVISPDEALRIGAVTRVVPASELDAAVDQVVETLASKSPSTMQLGRDAFHAVADLGFDAALDRLQAGLTAVATTDDALEGVMAFVQKRSPVWSGR
jgi:enoyl-CoA hydratase/carnithine racemase